MKRKLLLIGAGGHCKVILDLLLESKEYAVVGIIDLKERIGDNIFGVDPKSGKVVEATVAAQKLHISDLYSLWAEGYELISS
jgi:FlaA1/EpsC-like NDP-sugar epimerase